MKILIIIFLLLTKTGLAQEKEFRLSKDGFTDFLVIDCQDKSQSELYKKTLDWIAVKYNTPSEVIKGQIENEYIRIEGFANHVISSGTKYQIEISFKDGKYKFDLIKIQFYSDLDNALFETTDINWKEFDIVNTSKFVDENGKIIRKANVWGRVIKHFNSLNSSLYDFLMSEQIPSKKKDW